jgi:signal transduction histidine kinase
MNKVKGSLFAKFIAWLLFLSGIIMTIFFAVIIIAGIDYGYYTGTSIAEISSHMFETINNNYSISVYDGLSDNISNTNSAYMLDNGFMYGIVKAESVENIDFNVPENYTDGNFFINDKLDKVDEDYIYVYKIIEYNNGRSEGYPIGYYNNYKNSLNSYDTPELSVVYYIFSIIPQNVSGNLNGNMYERFQFLVDLIDTLGNIAIILTIAGILITLLAFIFLVSGAGHRKNKEGIVLTQFPDKIPFDIWSIVYFIAIAVIVNFCYELSQNYNTAPSIFIISSLTLETIVFSSLGLWYILGFATRIKYGKWWRNTLCYKIINSIKNFFVKIYENISLLWKFIIIGIALILINYWLAVEYHTFFIFLTYAIIFIAILWLIIQFSELQKASEKMADGDLSYKVDTSKMFFDFRKHGENLNKISEGMSKAVDERIKSEHFKTELITNVSHDIKTPLTSIINYVDLLGKEELNNEKATEYLEVLERQSSKLKKLIEDLVEASKASSGNLSVNNEKLEAGVFITQTVGEFEEKLSAAGLELIINKPEEPVYILADGRHLWRVMDNLMNNICKYAQPMSRVYVNLEADTKVHITFRNISKYPLNLSGEELMERFVRGDKSRNTEGHGLGLSITQSLIKLMNGEMDITVDGDLFKVILTFNRQMILSDEDENKIS